MAKKANKTNIVNANDKYINGGGAEERKAEIKRPAFYGDKIAIVGFAPTSVDLAPYGDDSWKIWACNEFYIMGKRTDLIFELHDYKTLDKKKRNVNHLDWLEKNKTIPVLMQKHFDNIPMSIEYPLKEILSKYGTYFSNTISYMIALAIEAGAKEIAIYGVDMGTKEEYFKQRPSCEYFIGIAVGKGIKVTIPDESDLLKLGYLYAYEDERQIALVNKIEAQKKVLNDQLVNNQYQVEQLKMQIAADRAVITTLENQRISRFFG